MMQEIVNYAYNLARGGYEEAQECFFLTGDWQKYQINKSDACLYLRTINAILKNISLQVENAHAYGEYEDNRINATKLFQYVFDRTSEAFYNTIIGKNIEILFNVEEALNGDYYELSIPDYLQIEINKVVPQIVLTAGNTYLFMQMKGYNNLPISQWLYIYLYSASDLAQQFLLEQDLNE